MIDKKGHDIVDCNGKILQHGDVIDIKQTVNGVNTFVIFSDENNVLDSIYYYYDNDIQYDYEYDYDDLLEINNYYLEKDLEFVKNILNEK